MTSSISDNIPTIKLKNLINVVLEDPTQLESVASRSLEHDNGFCKIVLIERTADDFGCRIHHWKPGTSDSNIHSHRWNMKAFILNGGYIASNYQESKKGSSYFEYEFKPVDNHNYRLFSNGIAYLNEYQNKHYRKGDCYEIAKGEIHKICKVDNEGAITAVISWGAENNNALVFSSSELEEYTSSQRILAMDEVKSFLEKTLTYLNT